MAPDDEDKICGKLDKIQTDVSDTKESVGRIEERVHGHDDSIDRHEGNITELFKSRDAHALTLKGIKVEDDTKEKLREKYSTKKQFRITWNMWIIGLLVAAIVTVSGWCIYLLRMIAAH